MGLILTILAYILIMIFYPLGLIFSPLFGKNYFWRLAISLDQFGNVLMGGFFNLTLIKDSKDEFGNPDETISSVIGKNKLNSKLTRVGRLLDCMLEFLDENHSIKSIE